MKNRLLTGILIMTIYVTFILLGIYVHHFFFDFMILTAIVLASFEMCKALGAKFQKPFLIFVAIFCFAGYAAFALINFFFDSGGLTAYFGVFAIAVIILIVFSMLAKNDAGRIASTLFVLIYPVTLLMFLMSLNYFGEGYRVTAIMLAFLVSIFTDVMAFCVGITLKGPKLMPSVSPKKTISGAVGGIIGGIGAGLIVMTLGIFGVLGAVSLSNNTVVNIMHFIILGLVGAVFTQAGDLIASYIKRICEIKDYGSLLPGHGGVLDRADGLMLNAVFIFIYMSIIMLI